MVKYINVPYKAGDWNFVDMPDQPLSWTSKEIADEVTVEKLANLALPVMNDMTILLKFSYSGKVYKVATVTTDEILANIPSAGKTFIANKLAAEAVELVAPENEELFKTYLLKDILKYFHVKNATVQSNAATIAIASSRLPGVATIVEYPCECSDKVATLWNIIQHLNDAEVWPREKIADWIDELHEAGTINAEFQPWDETEGETHE